MTRQLGLPTFLPAVLRWKAGWQAQAERVPGDKGYYCLDGSAMYPKDSHLRRAAWAVAWLDGGAWKTAAGTVDGPQTVGRAELSALLAVVQARTVAAQCVTDCKAAWTGFHSLRGEGDVPQWLLAGPMADLWLGFVRALVEGPAVRLRWVPAHTTGAEVLMAGGTLLDHTGNQAADEPPTRAATC